MGENAPSMERDVTARTDILLRKCRNGPVGYTSLDKEGYRIGT